MKHVWLILMFALFSAFAGAESVSPSDYIVQVWNTDDGLPDGTVTSIAQTPDGYLWLGTYHGGLSRFDGQRFVNFNPGNTPELLTFEIQKLLVDNQGTLWVGTSGSDLLSCRDGRFRFERQSGKAPSTWLTGILSSGSNSVTFSTFSGSLIRETLGNETNRWETIRTPEPDVWAVQCADRQGTIWNRTPDGRLSQVRSNQFVRVPTPGLRSPQINTLVTDAAGRLWVGTDKEIARWNGQAFIDMTPTNGEPDLKVQEMAACPDGTLWVWTDKELRRCRGQQWVARVKSWDGEGPRKFPNIYSVFDKSLNVFVDSRDGLWVSHYGDGLWHVDADGQVSRVREAQGLPNALVECWFEDREGNVWIGLNGGGVARLQARTFQTVWPTDVAARLGANSICEDPPGTMWFGTSRETLLRWRNNEFAEFTPPMAQTEGFNTTVFPGDAGTLWIGTVQNGVVALDHEKFSRPFPSADIGTVARVLYQDRRGRLWIGSDYGLFCWAQGKLKRFEIASVLAITDDAAGNLWIGKINGELGRYRGGQFTMYRPQDTRATADAADLSPSHGRAAIIGVEGFLALHADEEEEGVIWIGSLGGGLLRFQNGKFTRFLVREGLPNENVSQILEDGRGRLWLGTRNGIARVSKAALNQFIRGETNRVRFDIYDKGDGLPTVECSGGSQPACWRSRDGRLWFATAKGAVWVDPASVPFNSVPPPVIIEEISVDGRRVSAGTMKEDEGGKMAQHPDHKPSAPGSTLEIPPGRHYFEFKFTALSFTSPEKVRFRWRLAGLEPAWMGESSQRSASYSFVPPGNYEFQVRACNGDGVWNETGAAVKFTVRPYFWQTWWFKVALALLAGVVLWMIFAIRLARVRALQRERLRIARDLHDEVGAGLGTIALLGEFIEQHPTASDGQEVRQMALQTIDSLRDIIWFIDPSFDRMDHLVARLQAIAKARLPGFELNFRSSSDFKRTPLPLTFRRNMIPLFKEALHNILKHARARRVEIQVRNERNEFKLTISDNGSGFDPGKPVDGNGLKNMHRRAGEMNGRLEILRPPAGGTTLRLTVPLP